MDCHEARQWIDADTVPPEVARELAAHRQACDECRRAFAEAERVAEAVESLPVPTLPDAYWDAYAERVSDRVAHRSVRRRRTVVTAAIAAAAVLAVVVGTNLVFRDRGDDGAGDRVADRPGVAASVGAEADHLATIEDNLRRTEDRIADLLAAEKRRGLRRRLAQLASRPTAMEVVSGEIDRAARVSVYRADELASDRRWRLQAIRAYRLVVEQFPETHWAEVAKARLEALRDPRGGMNNETPHDETGGRHGRGPDADPVRGGNDHPC